MSKRPPGLLRCSFCNKSQNKVRKLIAGPSVFICDECVAVCQEIIADDPRLTPATEVAERRPVTPIPDRVFSGLAVRCALCPMPVPVEEALAITNRGVLCPGCVGEVEATLAERTKDDVQP